MTRECTRALVCRSSAPSFSKTKITQLARSFRHKHAAAPADQEDAELKHGGYTEVKIEREQAAEDRRGKRFRLGNHWWFSRDLDAGTRAYTRGDKVKRVWHGYYLFEAIDHLTHAPLSSTLFSASRQESDAYAEVFDRTTGHLGDIKPLAVVGDRGFSLPKVFAFNTDRGVASVSPYRRQNGSEPKKRVATSLYDEGGIPLCRYCKGDTHMDSFAVARGKGRLWVKCKKPQTPRCLLRQTLSCSANYRVLLPLWRDEQAYTALRVSHQNYEHKHRDLRIQYLLGPDCLALRPKRAGIGCQQLRANAALIIEWLRVLLRWGNLPGVATVTKTSDNGYNERMRQLRTERQEAASHQRSKSPPGTIQLAPG